MLEFSACMRKNGLPRFPDPKVSSRGVSISLAGSGLNPNSPQFKAAEKACEELIPGRPGSRDNEGETS